jgi:hypothetical protein
MRVPHVGPGSMVAFAVLVASCSSGNTGPGVGSGNFVINPCGTIDTVSLEVAQSVRRDCNNGGTTLTLAGNGASYLIVPQFATNLVVNQGVPYTLATGNLVAAQLSQQRAAAMGSSNSAGGSPELQLNARVLPGALQQRFERSIFTRDNRLAYIPPPAHGPLLFTPPTLGSTRTFRVLSNFDANTWSTITAKLAYLGDNIYLYIDVNAPTDGFTPTQLSDFGLLFDQTLYSIATTAFGQPSDLDANAHAIMLMSPLVNADTPASACASTGFVAGFFDSEDFNGSSDPNSNQGEIFYSIVPDPTGTVSCTHSVADVGLTIPATFLHEMEHLINYSQHVVVNHTAPMSSGLDEGLAIVAEELGSAYYEEKCPPPACRTTSTQLFPDSAQGFIQGFFNDSYLYAILPDTASLTLHNDSQNGFAWRGGDWALMRYLGDQYGNNFFHAMIQGPSDGPTAIASATGQTFPAVFANFGLALYADSFPGLPRTTTPAVNRFLSRNLRQLWARLYATAGPSPTVPRAMPLRLAAVTGDTGIHQMSPGAMSFWRLDTPASDPTVSIRFAAPGGGGFSAALRAQLAILRLPPGQ